MRRIGCSLRVGEARSGLRRRRAPSPDQDSALLITGQLFGHDDFVFQVFEVIVVQVEPTLEGSVRHPPLTLEQVKHLGQELVKGHDWPSPQEVTAEVLYSVLAYDGGCYRRVAAPFLAGAV